MKMNLSLKGGNYEVTTDQAVTFLNEYVYVDMVEDGEMDKIEASDDVFSLLVEAISDSYGGFYESLIEFLEEETKVAKLINLTPHDITLVNGEGEIILTVKPSGEVARVTQSTEQLATFTIDGLDIPVTQNTYGELVNLPEQEDGVSLIVSAMVASAGKALGRTDLFIPNETVRNDKGQIIGCKSLGKI